MADWTYSNWDDNASDTAATKLAGITAFIKEVVNKINADVAAHGYSRQNHPLIELLKDLREQQKDLRNAAAIGGGTTLATFPKR